MGGRRRGVGGREEGEGGWLLLRPLFALSTLPRPGRVEPLVAVNPPADRQLAGERPLAEGGLDVGREGGWGSSGNVSEESALCILFRTVGIGGLGGREAMPVLGVSAVDGLLSSGFSVMAAAWASVPVGSACGGMAPGGYSGTSKDDCPVSFRMRAGTGGEEDRTTGGFWASIRGSARGLWPPEGGSRSPSSLTSCPSISEGGANK